MNCCKREREKYVCQISEWKDKWKDICKSCDFSSLDDLRAGCKFAEKRPAPQIGRWNYPYFCRNVEAQLAVKLEEL